MANRKLKVHPWSKGAKRIAWCSADKDMTLGPGENRIFYQLGLKKNPGNGKEAFPDAFDKKDRPYAEVKSIAMKHKGEKGKYRLGVGQQEEFVDKVQGMLWAHLKPKSFLDNQRIFKKRLGIEFLRDNLSYSQWTTLQRDFLKGYFKAAGGRIILNSEEGYTVLDSSMLDRITISAITTRGVVEIYIDRSLLPFV